MLFVAYISSGLHMVICCAYILAMVTCSVHWVTCFVYVTHYSGILCVHFGMIMHVLFTCWQGYMLMCKALAGEGNDVLAASCLLKGMVHCNMTNDDTVNFIVQASQLLGKLKHDCPGRCWLSVAGSLVVDVGS